GPGSRTVDARIAESYASPARSCPDGAPTGTSRPFSASTSAPTGSSTSNPFPASPSGPCNRSSTRRSPSRRRSTPTPGRPTKGSPPTTPATKPSVTERASGCVAPRPSTGSKASGLTPRNACSSIMGSAPTTFLLYLKEMEYRFNHRHLASTDFVNHLVQVLLSPIGP